MTASPMTVGAAPDPLTPEHFDRLMRSRGWAHFGGCLQEPELSALRADTDRLYDICRAVQTRNGVAANMEGSAHHLVGYGTSLDALLDHFPLFDLIERYFAGKFIITTFSASLNPPRSKAYLAKPHRDVRAYIPGYRLMLNMLIMLDDFTIENGATLMLSGSHNVEEAPSQASFDAHAERATGRAGDILLFDSQLYHSAAPNHGDARRRGLTICLARPWVKPQIDFQRYVPEGLAGTLSPMARQLLGYNARVAASLDEYYQPMENWAFKADQR